MKALGELIWGHNSITHKALKVLVLQKGVWRKDSESDMVWLWDKGAKLSTLWEDSLIAIWLTEEPIGTLVRWSLREALSVLMLCAPVFTFTSSSSALLGRPRCGLLIWLLLLAIFNTLFWVCVNLFTRKRTNYENTQSPPFLYDTKMAADGY